MTAGTICARDVDVADPHESVQAAAQRMGSRNVGTLVVVDTRRRPVGILTDRDVAVRLAGADRSARTTRVSELMTAHPGTVRAETSIEDVLARMRSLGVRRLPVVDADDVLVGVVSADDVVGLLADELGLLGGLLRRSSPRSLAEV